MPGAEEWVMPVVPVVLNTKTARWEFFKQVWVPDGCVFVAQEEVRDVVSWGIGVRNARVGAFGD